MIQDKNKQIRGESKLLIKSLLLRSAILETPLARRRVVQAWSPKKHLFVQFTIGILIDGRFERFLGALPLFQRMLNKYSTKSRPLSFQLKFRTQDGFFVPPFCFALTLRSEQVFVLMNIYTRGLFNI